MQQRNKPALQRDFKRLCIFKLKSGISLKPEFQCYLINCAGKMWCQNQGHPGSACRGNFHYAAWKETQWVGITNMVIKSQLATLLTSVSLGKTPQTIRSTHAYSVGPGLTVTRTHTSARIQIHAPGRWGGGGCGRDQIQREITDWGQQIDGWGFCETSEWWCRI